MRRLRLMDHRIVCVFHESGFGSIIDLLHQGLRIIVFYFISKLISYYLLYHTISQNTKILFIPVDVITMILQFNTIIIYTITPPRLQATTHYHFCTPSLTPLRHTTPHDSLPFPPLPSPLLRTGSRCKPGTYRRQL